jgi:hypothetical protein
MEPVFHLAAGLGWVIALGALTVGLGFLYVWLRAGVPAFLTFRGTRVVTCPENGHVTAVEVDARRAATTAFRRQPELRLAECSRWPEKAGCGQECLRQIEAAPEDCLVKTMLARWYAGKKCVYCGQPFATVHWHDHKPALLGVDGRTVEWGQVPPEQVPAALAHDRPVCWNCHIAETFRREHPELVVDRSRPDYAPRQPRA